MNRIRASIVFSLALLLIFALDVFFSGLTPPFNAAKIAAIGIFLVYLFSPLPQAIVFALIMGTIQDYALLHLIGAQSASYALGILLVAVSKKTIITHENFSAVLLSGVIFFAIVLVFEFVRIWNIAYASVAEMFFRVIINSAIAGIGYLVIQKIQREINKRFL